MIDWQVRLKNFPTELRQKLNLRSAEVPHERFNLSHLDRYERFRSSERIQLLAGLLEGKPSRDGCGLDFNRMCCRPDSNRKPFLSARSDSIRKLS